MLQVKEFMVPVLLDIAEVAARSRLAPSALRFYEKRGLIAPDGRNGLRRTYRPEVLDRLALIGCARGAGFTIAEIGKFLAATPSDTELRAKMAAKARALEEDIDRLTRMRDSLRHASTCPHEPLIECPDFKRTFKNSVPAAPSPASVGFGAQADGVLPTPGKNPQGEDGWFPRSPRQPLFVA